MFTFYYHSKNQNWKNCEKIGIQNIVFVSFNKGSRSVLENVWSLQFSSVKYF